MKNRPYKVKVLCRDGSFVSREVICLINQPNLPLAQPSTTSSRSANVAALSSRLPKFMADSQTPTTTGRWVPNYCATSAIYGGMNSFTNAATWSDLTLKSCSILKLGWLRAMLVPSPILWWKILKMEKDIDQITFLPVG